MLTKTLFNKLWNWVFTEYIFKCFKNYEDQVLASIGKIQIKNRLTDSGLLGLYNIIKKGLNARKVW